MQTNPTKLMFPSAPVAPHGNCVESYRLYVKAHAHWIDACERMFKYGKQEGRSDPLTTNCKTCGLAFVSRNQMWTHVKAVHWNKPDEKQPKSTPKVPSRKKADLARIRKLESQIQNARLNNEVNHFDHKGTVSDLAERIRKRKISKQEADETRDMHSVRNIRSLPLGIHMNHDVPAFEVKSGKNSDLEFELLDLPGYSTTDYVDVPNGTLQVKALDSATIERLSPSTSKHAEPGDTTSEVVVNKFRQAEISFRFSDDDTNAGPKTFTSLEDSHFTRDAFRSTSYPQPPTKFYEASSLNPSAVPFISHSAFPEPSGTWHERRESIFSRAGDDELFDSE